MSCVDLAAGVKNAAAAITAGSSDIQKGAKDQEPLANVYATTHVVNDLLMCLIQIWEGMPEQGRNPARGLQVLQLLHGAGWRHGKHDDAICAGLCSHTCQNQ